MLQQTYALDCAVSVDAVDEGMPHLHMDESYTLEWTGKGAKLHAKSTWGALRGLATLQQLVVAGCTDELVVQDQPRFPWRGLLLDVARHFISVDHLKQVLDGMFLLKLNVLHLHLTDDQAVRVRSERFDKLGSEQAYSLAQLTEVVQYAADLGIRIVPEFDVPGHVTHWLTRYPELAPAGFAVEPTRRFGVHPACLDPTSDAVYEFLRDLFTEAGEVFPDAYLHIGGDEVHPRWWSDSEEIGTILEQQTLTPGDLQNQFNRRLVEILSHLGKQAVGWDEVLHAQTPDLLVQNWRGATTRDVALSRQLDCLVSAGFYLDLFYPAETHYTYDPGASQQQLLMMEDAWQEDLRMAHVAAGVEWTKQWRKQAVELAGAKGAVLGGEACLWSELVDEKTLATRLWSRLPAVAERLWSPAAVQDVDAFYQRLGPVLEGCFNHGAQQLEDLAELGLAPDQVPTAMLLEPVKWYARLLGEQALAARLAGAEMPQARPYTVDTPLNRIVDFISPESLRARSLAAQDPVALQELALGWQSLDAGAWPEDVKPAISALGELGRLLAAHLAGEVDADTLRDGLTELYRPYGEYMLAPVPALLRWLDA